MYEVSGSRQCEPLLVSLSSEDGPVMVRRMEAQTGKFKKIAFFFAYVKKKYYLCSKFE